MAGIPGFDTGVYPGDTVMAWLKANTNFQWTGFYLGPAPSHHGNDWMAKRALLAGQGWGFAPVYLGQQVTGPGSHNSSQAQGVIDGRDAATLMTSAGFGPGTCVYLDIENGPPLTQLQIDYLSAWVDQIIAAKFQPGVYCSHFLAEQVHAIRSQVRIWAYKVGTTAPHPVPGNNFPDLHPAGSGYAGAFAWQLGDECIIDCKPAALGKLQVDLDTAIQPDPSAP